MPSLLSGHQPWFHVKIRAAAIGRPSYLLVELVVPSQLNSTQLNEELELKMFYQTYTARKPPSACAAVTPSLPAATQWYRLLLSAAYGVPRTAYYALSMGMTQQFFLFFFVHGHLDLSPLTLTFKLVRARD